MTLVQTDTDMQNLSRMYTRTAGEVLHICRAQSLCIHFGCE